MTWLIFVSEPMDFACSNTGVNKDGQQTLAPG